jgi:protein-tyrosine phosphatase
MPATSVLFVCLGNICRSPLAEGLFLHRARETGAHDGFRVDSCGTGGWHAGERPDPRMLAVAEKHGVKLPSLARRLDPRADGEFDLIVPMDRSNRDHLLDAGLAAERVRLLRTFDPQMAGAPEEELCVPDPYHGGPEGFDLVFEMVDAAVLGMLEELGASRRD